MIKMKDRELLIIIILFKVLLLIFFSSYYSSELFLPFVSKYIDGFQNPWDYYLFNNMNDLAFPFHTMMLLILSPFVFLINIFNIEAIFIQNFIFKFPLLLADLSILYTILKFTSNNKKRAIYFYYFSNPIIIYAIYVHSQLDIIPTAILLWAIYFLVSKKYTYSSVFLGLALATKFHIIVALPLIVFYLYKTTIFKNILKYILISLSIFLVFDLPFLFSEGFQQMVLFNHKQSLIFSSFYNIGESKLLLPVAAILTVYMHFFNQNKVNDDLLWFYFGVLFVAVLFFVYPSPGWYVWFVPFIVMYFIQNDKTKNLILYFVFSIAYLTFFIFFYKSGYKDILFLGNSIDLKIENDDLINLSFTFLEVILLAIMYAFYKYGIKSNSVYKKQTNLTIGIGGDSGVGKSTLLNNLEKLLGADKFLQIEGDGEHKWERGDENWNKFTHLDPKANHIHKQAEAIYELKHNQTIYRSEYVHSNGKFTQPLKVEPKEFIVIAGLHPFYLPKLRKNIDLKIYIDTDENLRRHWKILRDTKKRGYSIEKILHQIESRMDDAKKYIYPQKDFADIVIQYFSTDAFELGSVNANINMGLKLIFDANIHIENILERLECEFVWDYNDDLKSQYIELNTIPEIDVENIAIDTIDNINEIITPNAKWDKGYDGIIQLISLKMISEKLKEDND